MLVYYGIIVSRRESVMEKNTVKRPTIGIMLGDVESYYTDSQYKLSAYQDD